MTDKIQNSNQHGKTKAEHWDCIKDESNEDLYLAKHP